MCEFLHPPVNWHIPRPLDTLIPMPNQPINQSTYPIDLQTHSTRSDGTETPAELVAHAARLGIRVMALTDHDSVLGVDEALAAGAAHGVRVIPALEYSTTSAPDQDFLDINILGYGIRHNDPDLQAMLQKVIDSRVNQKIEQIEKLQSYGFDIPVQDVLDLAGGVPGRPHMARILMERNPGRFADISQVFREYLAADAENSTFVIRTFSLSVEETIEVTHRAGGVAVLAHPGLYDRVQDVDDVVRRLKAAGLDGLEIWYPYRHSRGLTHLTPTEEHALIRHFSDLADELGLLKTGGSDYHGATKPLIHLGMAGLDEAQWAALGWEIEN